MPFDFDGYLANKAAANDKVQAVINASNEKVAGLKAYDASKAPAATSWVDQLGLTPGGFVANRVNDAASLVSGAARVAGQVASLPVSLLGEDQTHAAQPGDIDAYNRYVTGKATPDDVARLNFQPESGNPTLLQRFQTAEAARGTARAISDAFDLTGIVNQQNRQGLQTDLAKGFQPNWDKVQSGEAGQMISGLAGLLVNAGSALLQNPSAVREHILENIPQLFVGAAGKTGQVVMAASNVGYAVDEFQKFMENYAKANGGALPPLEQQQTKAIQAASLALAEQVVDVVSLGAAKAVVGDAAKAGFMQSMKGVLKAGAQGVATEAPTEGFQTYMEGQIEGTPKSAQEIYNATVIGGASGGGLTAGGRTVAELAGATPEQVAVRNKAAEKAAVLDEAIQSGDVTNLTNPKSKDYAPAQAIAALYGNSQLDTTDDATKQANVQKADVILAELEKQRAVVAANQLDPDKRQATIDDLKRRLSVQTDPEMKELYQQEIADLEAIAAKPVNKAEARVRQAKLEKLDAELAEARQSRNALGMLVMPKEQVEGSLKALQDPARVADHAAEADKVITLAMAAPGRVDPKTAAALADDTQNGLTDAQRGYLRQFSDARLAALKLMGMGEVSQAIYFGNKKKGDVGIAEYRAGITAAIAAGDRKSAYRQISALQRFSDSHTGKAAAANGAKAQGFGSQIHRTKTGEWVVASPAENLWPADLQRNGGLAIKSSELVSNIGIEAGAIAAAAQEMRSAYALKFNNPGANDVQNTSREEAAATSTQPEAQAAKDSAKAGPSSDEDGKDAVSAEGAASFDADVTTVARTKFRREVLEMFTRNGEDDVSAEGEAILAQIPVRLQRAVMERQALLAGLREGDEVLDDEDAAQAREDAKPRLTALNLLIKELYQKIDSIYDGQNSKTTEPSSNEAGEGTVPDAGAGDVAVQADGVGKFDSLEAALRKERDSTTSEIENGWMDGKGRRQRTAIERAVYDAVTASTLDADAAAGIVETALKEGRADLALYVAQRAARAAESMSTTPGVSESSPKYEAIKNDLVKRKQKAQADAKSLLEKVTKVASPASQAPAPARGDATGAAAKPAAAGPGAVEAAGVKKTPTYGEAMLPLNVADLDLPADEAADPLVQKFIAASDKSTRAEKVRSPSEWTPEQAAAYEAGDYEKFSRLSGYTEEEIKTWREMVEAAEALDAKYGADYAASLSFGMSQLTDPALAPATPPKTGDTITIDGKPAAVEGVGIRTPDLKSIPDAKLLVELGVLVDLGSERTAEQQDRFKALDTEMTRREDEAYAQMAEQDVAVQADGVKLKDGGRITIQTTPAPGAFSSLNRMAHGEPIALVASNEQGEEVGRLIYMPNGGPIDSFVREQDRRRGIASALYDAYEAAGGKLLSEESGAIISEEARALRKSRTVAREAQTKGTSGSSESSVAVDSTAKSSGSTVENQSTEEITVEQQPNADGTLTSAGQLSSLTEKSPEGTLQAVQQQAAEKAEFNEKLLGDFVTQDAGREDSASKRPLVMVKDFLSKLDEGVVQLQDYLKKTLTDPQRAAIDTFMVAVSSWVTPISQNLPKPQADKFRYQDMISFLIEPKEVDGKQVFDVEENVKTAMAAAIFAFVSDSVGRSAINTDSDINNILGRSADAYVPWTACQKLGMAGAYQHTVIDSLGTKIIDALGLKARKDAGQDLLPRLRTALGGQALKLMEDKGIVRRTTIDNNTMTALRRDEDIAEVTSGGLDHIFFALARDKELQPTGLAKRIAEATRGSGNVLQNLFGIETGAVMPSLEPIQQMQKSSDTGMGIPGLLRTVLKQKQTNEQWRVNKDPMAVLAQFDDNEELTHELIGVKEITEQNTHIYNERSRKAKNDGLIREFELFSQFVGEYITTSDKGMDQEFFLKYDMWKQQRVGIETTAANPQASKIHRWLMGSPEWETTIALNDKATLDSFMLRVAEGFGVKTERSLVDVSVRGLKERMQEPGNAKAVTALQAVIFQEGAKLTDEQKKDIAAAVTAGKEKLHTLSALIAWARYAEALQKGEKEFTTSLVGEVDGVANGTMLNSVLYGAGESEAKLLYLLERGGMFTVHSGVTQYNQYRARPGARDIYEETATEMFGFINWMERKGKVSKGVVAAIWNTAGVPVEDGTVTKDGRDMVKDALNPLNFGSGFKAILNGMSATYLEGIYAGFEKLSIAEANQEQANQEQVNQEQVNLFVNSINVLLKTGGAQPIPVGKPISFYMRNTFDFKQERVLMDAHKEVVGYAAQKVVKRNFEAFLERRKQMTDATQLTFDLYNAAYKALRKEYIDKVGIPRNKAGVPMHDLSAEQEVDFQDSLREIAPLLDTAMSKDDNEINNGILLAKKARTQDGGSIYETVVRFGSTLKNGARQLTAKPFTVQQASPGPLAISASTHSLDSRISHLTQRGRHILNIHDAVADGIGRLAETATEFNHNTYDTLMGYSPLRAAHVSLSRVVEGLAKMHEEGKLSPAAIQNIKAMLDQRKQDRESGPAAAAIIPLILSQTFAAANEADTMKYGVLAKLVSMDQYAFFGGNYRVTEANRAEAETALKAVPKKQEASIDKAVDTLQKLLFEKPATPTAVDAVEGLNPEGTGERSELAPANSVSDPESAGFNRESTVDNEEDIITEPATSPFGALAESSRNDPEILGFFTKNPNTTAKAVLNFLYGYLGKQESTASRDYSAKLTKALMKILPPNLPVQLITPATKIDDVITKPDQPARGWYSSKGGKSSVYVVGQGFAQSALQTEVLLHELVHPAVAHRLDTAEGKPYKAELTNILNAARAYVKKHNISGYEAELSSVDEMVAYGMTNQKFQQMVLAQVRFQSTTTSKLGSALQAFVATLARLLGFKDTDSANALGALISNVSALFEQQAAESQTKTLSMTAGVNNYSTLEILDGLDDGKGTLSQAFQEQMRSVLGSIVQGLHGPFGSFKAALMENQALSPMDVWLKALATGEAPFASTIMASGLKITSQEAFAIEQVEATVRSALNSSETRTKVAYRQLAELYTEVYRNAKAQDFHSGDWSKATDAEKAKANELYEFVFKLEKSSGDRSDYLARFAALGLGHQGFNQVLQRATERNTRKVSDAKSFGERLQIVFENILDFFRSKITSTYAGQKADVKLRTLVSQLVDIEAKNRFFIATEVSKTTLVEKLEDVGKGLNKKLSGAAEKILNSSWLRNNSSGMIQGADGVARTIVGNRVDEFMDVISRIRDKHVKERHGAWMSLVGEAVGPNEQAKFLLLGTKHNEKLRKDIINAVSNTALSVFANGGQDMTYGAKAAITQAFMRSGAHTLLDHYTMAQIEGLLIDPKQLAAAIRQIEGQLPVLHCQTGNAREYYIHQVRALGYFKITGKVTSQKMMSNAGNIARMFATPYRGKISEEVAATAQKSLEPLVSLYALSYLSHGTRAQAAAVLKAENARTDGNGVEFVLKLHRQLENESRDRLFQGSNALMVHGYTPEILNPYTDIQIANDVKDPVTGKSDGDELQDRGWSKGAMVPVDPADPDRDRRHIYLLRGAGLGARQTGIISWTNMANKGSQKHSGYLNPATQNGLANAQLNASVMNARQAAIQKMFTAGASFDPTKVGTTYMAPIVNPQGDIVNWRYLMQEDNKDQLLERDNRFEHILGVLAGSIFDKETTASQNKKAMQALKEQHDAEYSKQADRYIWVGADSKDEDLRETWALLPDVTKQDVKAIWGGDGLFVRKDSLDIVFGYRKLSAAKKIVDSLDARQKLAAVGLPSRVWDLDSQEFNTLQKLAIISMETMLTVWARTRGMNQEKAEAYSKRAATMITRGGRLWSEAVAETKDLIVVKTGTTLLGNIWSNLSTLVINGVPWKDIIHHHSVALKGATAYHADMDELQRLKLLLDSGHTLGKENQIRRDILRLEDSIARNPITKLVDAGLMPTIVEDIASEEDIYSYKSALVRKTESVTSQLPDSIRNLAKTVYMTHDTPLYQGLSRVTQLSDFVARYTLYQHLVNRKINPLTEKDALSRAVDSFIMYDVPMHPMLQYADDTGLFMFTKYFLRIQRVLRTMWMDNPARTLSALLLDNTMGLGPIVLDSAAALRIGNNPLESGAFKFFGSLDELMTIKPVMSVFGGSSGGNWK